MINLGVCAHIHIHTHIMCIYHTLKLCNRLLEKKKEKKRQCLLTEIPVAQYVWLYGFRQGSIQIGKAIFPLEVVTKRHTAKNIVTLK